MYETGPAGRPSKPATRAGPPLTFVQLRQIALEPKWRG